MNDLEEIHVLEAALVSSAWVQDCRVLVRETATGDSELVAYVVLADPVGLEPLRAQMQSVCPQAQSIAFVQISNLPLTDTGAVDDAILTRLEVIDTDLIQRWEERLKLLPEVEEVAVVVGERRESLPSLHLSDMLPEWRARVGESGGGVVAAPAGSKVPDARSKSTSPALSHGSLLARRENAPTTLAGSLHRAARQKPLRELVYVRRDDSALVQSYAELLKDAQRVLAGLRSLGLKPSSKVIFQLEDNQDFIPAFWGCVLGGIVPVPISVAPAYEPGTGLAEKILNAWRMLDEPVVLTGARRAPEIRALADSLALDSFQIETVDQLRGFEPDPEWHESQPEDLALLLLTSGSTGLPKCVMLNHRNLLSMSAGTASMNNFSDQDVTLNWLPLDHVGALVFLSVMAVDLGCQQVQVPTELILADPIKWLDLLCAHRATISWGPNFAFTQICDAAEEVKQRRWDLSSMRFLVNAGEAVVAKSARKFLRLLQPHGLHSGAIHPAFGMSETCSGITWSSTFSLGSTSDELSFVELGPPIAGASLRIVDSSDGVLTEGEVGRLQVRGDSVTAGYFQNPEANREAFTDDGWFKTGDLGYLQDGCLTITGREKDQIVINGVNVSSHELESAVEEVEGVVVSYTAACAVRSPASDREQLAIFFCPKSAGSDCSELLTTVRAKMAKSCGVNPDYLIPINAEAVPKTAIGKIQRAELGKRFEAGEFDEVIKHLDILSGNANTVPDWFYEKVWRRKAVAPNVFAAHSGGTLVFLDRLGLGAALCAQLRGQGRVCVRVESGPDFARLGSGHYRISPGEADHYRRLFESLASEDILIGQILHLWTYDEYAGEVASMEALEQAQIEGSYSVLFLVQALAAVQGSEPAVRMHFVSSHAQSTSPGDAVAYEKSPVLGVLKTIPHELPWLACRHIDLALDAVEVNTSRIAAELRAPSGEREVAYRNGHRLVSRLKKADLSRREKHPLPFKQGGIYLISGGLGGIGVQIARYLLERHQARLLLIGTTPLPERDAWKSELGRDTVLSRRLRAYQSLEELGGELIYKAVDVCDREQLREALGGAEARWSGKLDGVIHLAGVLREATLLEESEDGLGAALRPKLQGTWVLRQLLEGKPSSLFIHFSSIGGFLGAMSLGAYAAANSFVDTYAGYEKHRGRAQSYCFAWSMWQDTGMSAGYQMKELARRRGYCTISPQQGLNSFLAGLHHERAQLLVGLDGTNRHVQHYTDSNCHGIEGLTAYFTLNGGQETSVNPASLMIRDRFQGESSCDLVRLEAMPLTDAGAVDRERLTRFGGAGNRETNERIAPRTEIERQLSRIWEKSLKMSPLGVHDNFFELGGSSMMAMVVVNELQSRMKQVLLPVALFNAPTIAELATYLETHYPEATGRISGRESAPKTSGATRWSRSGVRPEVLSDFRRRLACVLSSESAFDEQRATRNKPVIFILCPPRSGSTLLRVMLAGNPQLFAPPELHLLSFNTLGERKAALSGRFGAWDQGAVTALRQMKGATVGEARELMTTLEGRGVTTHEFYSQLQTWLRDKILVDKTPSYAFNPEVLNRAEAEFEDPSYVHLLRHPCGAIRSMEEMRVDLLLALQAESEEGALTAREQAERIWLICHQNILKFLAGVPTHRQFQLKFEDLVTQPGVSVETLCRFLAVHVDPGMLEPYKDGRMTDGIGSVSRMIGDPKFYHYERIEARVADSWRQDPSLGGLGEETWRMAERFGYERVTPGAEREEGEI